MTPERWQRVKRLFSVAIGMPEADRHAFLADACEGDPDLLTEVVSLLVAHAEEQAIVDVPAAVLLAGEPLAPEPDYWIGRQVGPWKIVALIAHGGMGDVYRARRVDAEYDKEVAIKLVPGSFRGEHLLQRFRAERQILAQFDHPNIARLLDGGATEDGLPYLVMELVEGVPIDRYVEENALSLAARLGLFLEVCGAVSYAHRHLVVHRDLKPGNILVTADGGVKLLDFGIAKLLQPVPAADAHAPTVTLMRALTPGYSSPEQVLGKPITTASDVYSLGVVLFVLLTGRSPYGRALGTAEEAMREVCDTEPPRPSTVAPVPAAGSSHERLGRDLDAIVLRALRKEPERRYASVEQFAEDVRRYLAGLPVVARGDRFSYRAGKFLRRRRVEVAAALALLVTLVAATVVSVREARIAEGQRARAERHFASVRQLADTFLFRVHDEIKDLQGSTEARKLLVGTALEYLDTLAREAAGDRALQRELAAAYEKVADIQGQAYGASHTGEPRAALDSYARAAALLEPVVAAEPGDLRAREALARNHLRQSRLLLLLGDSGKAAAASRRSVAMFEALAEAQPDATTRGGLAEALAAHAYTLDMTGEHAAGIASARASIAILEDLAQRSPGDLDLAYRLGTAYSHLAITVLGEVPDAAALEESLAFHRKSLAVSERLFEATEGTNARYARALLLDRFNVAFVLCEKGDYLQAVESARAAQPLVARLGADASNVQARIDGANLAWPLGRALLELGRIDEAAAVFSRNAEVLREIARSSDTLKVQYLLGTMAFGLGEVHWRRSQQATLGRAARLGQLREAERRYAEALPHFDRVTASVELDHMDMRPVREARAGLARSREALDRLGAGTAG